MRTNKFYILLNEPGDNIVIMLCFDLMQDQALSKSSIGEAYYARKPWLYFFAVVEHKHGQQTKNDVTFYNWDEHQQGSGANQIASAVHNFITERLSRQPRGRSVRLFSDSCTGQNNNFFYGYCSPHAC